MEGGGQEDGPMVCVMLVSQHNRSEQFDFAIENLIPLDDSLGSGLHLPHHLSTGGDVLDEGDLTEGRIGGGVDCLGVG